MIKEKNFKEIVLIVLSVSLLITTLMSLFITDYYNNMQFRMLGSFCEELINKYPDHAQGMLELLKEQNLTMSISKEENVLTSFGYRQSDFCGSAQTLVFIVSICFLAGALLFLSAFWSWNRKIEVRISQLTSYLENINTGKQGLLVDISDDKFSRLQDEIYKTNTTLYQAKEMALKSKENYADNLSNIAHQLKTPITVISLLTQMIKENPSYPYIEQIQKQLNSLAHLEEALLVLSCIDAGTLPIKPTATDVFTLLTLASDNLQELFKQVDVDIVIPENDIVEVLVDMDWTMEAIMNVMKNCMEHSPKGGTVHCYYKKNPLYVQIQIWDEGEGFDKEELCHIFERFYRGKNEAVNGIGIGLPLAKAIIEMQNGIIRAFNQKTGGACIEIRFYSH